VRQGLTESSKDGEESMYSEKNDFLHHRKEIDDFFECLNKAKVLINDTMTVLDLGAGQGMHAGFLAEHFRDVYCSDIIHYTSLYGGEFFKLLKEKYERNGYRLDLQKVHFIRTDAMSMSYRENFFDMIISFNVFEHIPEPEVALKEMIRCTRNGGYVFIQFDPIWTADTGSHFSHRVTEPWAHLVLSEEDFTARMKASGAADSEVEDYRTAMNRKRLRHYRGILRDLKKGGDIRIVTETYWSGFADESHRRHPFFAQCLKEGFDKEELCVRGGRFLLRVEKTRH
jgi:ubiquinone/menaquinone biosynthesis C-methylase UbiE